MSGSDDGVVTVRAPRRDLVVYIGLGSLLVGLAAADWLLIPVQPGIVSGSAWIWLAVGCGWVAEALWLFTLSVDLTRESAIVRDRRWRRRTILWKDVREVVCRRRFGYLSVQLIPAGGRPVTVRVLTARRGRGAFSFQSDYELIGRWFLAHQRPCEHPTGPELAVQG